MKKLVLLLMLLPLALFAQKDECAKHFLKEKKKSKKSKIFGNDEDRVIQTKYMRFYRNGARQLVISFKRTDQNYIVVQQVTTETMSFKTPFVLGAAIRIGIAFENGENYILKFPGNENKVEITAVTTNNYSSNQAPIDSTFDRLLKTSKMTMVELQNPFNNLNQSKIRSEDIKKGDAEDIVEFYNCFVTKAASDNKTVTTK